MSSTFLSRREMQELTAAHRKRRQIEILRTQHIPFFINALGWPVVPRTALVGGTSRSSSAWEPPVLQGR